MAEFILRRVIRLGGLPPQTDNSSKYKRILLHTSSRLHDWCFRVEEPSCENIETSPSHVKTSSKNRLSSI